MFYEFLLNSVIKTSELLIEKLIFDHVCHSFPQFGIIFLFSFISCTTFLSFRSRYTWRAFMHSSIRLSSWFFTEVFVKPCSIYVAELVISVSNGYWEFIRLDATQVHRTRRHFFRRLHLIRTYTNLHPLTNNNYHPW